VIEALISAGGALLGAGVGGAITYRVQRAERDDRQRGEAAAAATALLFALDILQLEIDQLTPPSRLGDRSNALIDRHLPLLGWVIGRLNRATVGRRSERALRDFMHASSRVLVGGPDTLNEKLLSAHQLLARLPERDEDWDEQWSRVRTELAIAARDAAHPARRSRRARRRRQLREGV
jgi:hypothetical protein